MSNIIEKIKKKRIELGVTQLDVAKKMGVPQTTISRIERQVHSPSLEILERYADAVGCRIDIVSK